MSDTLLEQHVHHLLELRRPELREVIRRAVDRELESLLADEVKNRLNGATAATPDVDEDTIDDPDVGEDTAAAAAATSLLTPRCQTPVRTADRLEGAATPSSRRVDQQAWPPEGTVVCTPG